MTEDEARTKWCPMARPGTWTEKSTGYTMYKGNTCVASACMMWHKDAAVDRAKADLGHCGLISNEAI